MKKICVVGMGYIGLPTAVMFAASGCIVNGVELNEEYIKELASGTYDFKEPCISDIFRQVTEEGRLTISTLPEKSDVFIIAVPTPLKPGNKADMSYVKAACKSVLPFLEAGNILILESTSPVGTIDELVCPLIEEYGLSAGSGILVAYSPERVIPGNILKELVDNERIVGGVNKESAEAAKAVYEIFVKGAIHITDSATAEICKLAENTYRDINIAFSNELLTICESEGVNVWEAVKLCNRHPRVNILSPGPGVGGHCIAVDPWFLLEKHSGSTASIIKSAREINDSMPAYVAEQIKKILMDLHGTKKVTFMGVSYKADVDDTRESPILKIIDILSCSEDFEISIYDPVAKTKNISWSNSENAFKNSDLLVLSVAHSIFSEIDFCSLKSKMKHLRVLDTRNALSRAEFERMGFSYYLLGGHSKKEHGYTENLERTSMFIHKNLRPFGHGG